MSDKSLRSKIIRLAHQKPELRDHLLPLVTKKSDLKVSAKTVREGGKIGFLRPRTGRYSYAKVEKIDGDRVFLNEGGWNKFEMSLKKIIGFSKEKSKDVPNKFKIKIM